MSFTEVLAELPEFSLAQRQALIRRALELDDAELSTDDQLLVDERSAAHRANPESAVPLETVKARLRAKFAE